MDSVWRRDRSSSKNLQQQRGGKERSERNMCPYVGRRTRPLLSCLSQANGDECRNVIQSSYAASAAAAAAAAAKEEGGGRFFRRCVPSSSSFFLGPLKRARRRNLLRWGKPVCAAQAGDFLLLQVYTGLACFGGMRCVGVFSPLDTPLLRPRMHRTGGIAQWQSNRLQIGRSVVQLRVPPVKWTISFL